MSAFMCSELHFQTIHDTLTSRFEKDIHGMIGIFFDKDMRKITKLVNDLVELNRYALRQRYGEKGDEGFGVGRFKISEYTTLSTDNISLVKLLQSLQYQCAEGDAMEKPTYKKLEELISIVNEMIVSKIPEYDEADWSI
jgi:hypothetical protein